MQNLANNLADLLSEETPQISAAERKTHAAVAAVIAEIEDEPQLLFIQRSESPLDRWSGHLAFPGGRIDAEDADLQATAVRETAEEIGLDLTAASYLGCLPPCPTLTGRVLIGTFVYMIDEPPKLTLDPTEVADTFWIPVNHLTDPERTTTHAHETGEYPAVDILGGTPLLWGLTLRICKELFTGPKANDTPWSIA